MDEKAITKWKIVIVLLLVIVSFAVGAVFGGWYQTERFRNYLEKIPDINQCYGDLG